MSNPAIQKIVRPARRAIIDVKSTLVKTLQALMDGTQSHLYKAETFHKNGVLSTKQYESLQNNDWATDEEDPLLAWLNRQKPSLPESRSSSPQKKERPRIIPTPRDPEEPRGTFIELSTGNVPGSRGWTPSRQAIKLLLTVQDLYKVKSQRRDDMYHVMCYKLRGSYMEQAQNQILRYNEACKALTEQKRLRDAALLRKEGIQVVGCTVTGLCKYRALIKDLAPEIMLIDEASEAFEATITAALFPSLQQLSLVGDHQQLTPRSGSRLASLDVSLFERLIGMIDYKVLLCQRRMVPNIRSVISGFYPQIHDHITVTQRHTRFSPNLWWFDHSWPDSITAKKSFCNTTEAEMVVQLAQHLLSNGTAAEKITILTFYTGQKEAITQLLYSKRQQGDADNCESDEPGQHGDVSRVAVRTVDGFQGCENNVIILSLVRSRRPGFIADVHRATVALSRARDAMFVFGSTSTLTHSGSRCFSSWASVLNSFQQQAAIGPHLPNTAEWNDVLQQIVTADGAESGLQQPAMTDKEDWLDAQHVPDIFAKLEKSLDVDTVLLKFDSDLLIDIGYSTATSKLEGAGAHIPQMDQSAEGMLIDLEEESCIEDLIGFD
jgi:helicase required for RNAi-mediated heterochromatin assembly 1